MRQESVTEYIQRCQNEAASIESDLEKRKKNIKRIFLIFLVSLVVAFLGVTALTRAITAIGYSNLKSAAEAADIEKMLRVSTDPDALSYKDGVLIFEKIALGNSNQNAIMQAGLVCSNGDVKYQAISGALVKYEGKESKTLVQEDCSYLNSYKDGLLFRYDATRSLAYSNGKTITKVLPEYTVGEVLTCGDSIFFINSADHNTLWISTDSKTANKIADEKCQSFAIAGNRVILLSSENQLIAMRWDGTGRKTINGVQSFILTDKIYAYSNGTLFTCGVNFKKPKLVCKNIGFPLYIGHNGIYFQRDTSIVLLQDGKEQLLLENVLVCKGIFENSESEVVIRTLTIDSEGKKDENTVCKIEGKS